MFSLFAHSLSLVRYFAFIAWGGDMRRFHQLIISVSHQGKAAVMTAWRLAARPSTRPAARVLVSPLCSLFIVHSCRSKQKAAAFFIYPVSPLASFLAPLNPPPRCPLPHSLRLFRLVPHSLRSSRLASRLPSRSHAVPSPAPFSSRPVLPNCRTAFRSSCGRAVLFSSSCRSPHALPSSLSHNRMSDDAGRERIPHHGHEADNQ